MAGYQNGEYPVFGRGWFPDFPDPDNFVAPFVGKQNALGTPYPEKKITQELLPHSRQESDRAEVAKDFEGAQQILVRRRPAAAPVAGQAVHRRVRGRLAAGSAPWTRRRS